jgi:predicted AlkP superfamily pyrophosphatase or phosphodiesterase
LVLLGATTMKAQGRVVATALLALGLTLPSGGNPVLTAADAPAGQTTGRPRLLVLIAVDQFRADYLPWYGTQWTSGLHRLFTQGAVFARATTPWAVTRTCSGHASIGTGALPSSHGLVGNEWYDRDERAFVACTTDPAVDPITLGGARATERHSARWLRVPTLGEELRRQGATPPRVVSIALKARSAIGLGGRGGESTVILWEEDSGTWATSSAFASTPWPFVVEHITRHRPETSRGAQWNRLLPVSRYLHEDQAAGEPAAGQFPHRLIAPAGVPFAAVWDRSPWSDAYVADLAAAMVTGAGLGQRDTTDLLAIGFSALDYVGHTFGPRSHEVQDVLVRLDQTLGRLFDVLDRHVGADRYVVGFTSDHGVALLPEQAAAVVGISGGRLNPGSVATAVDLVLRTRLGRRPSIEAVNGADLYFAPGVLDAINNDASLAAAVTAAAEAVPGVDRAFLATELQSPAATTDDTLIAMRASYMAGRSGDLTILPSPHWVVASSGTHHGSAHAYDREVPVVFLGSTIAPGHHTGATPLDVAPTLAALAGIALPQAQGVARREVTGP